jgi:hypothetical protein
MIWLYTYLGGVALKTLLMLFSSGNYSISAAFNEIVLWPLYILFDIFMFFASFWFEDKD